MGGYTVYHGIPHVQTHQYSIFLVGHVHYMIIYPIIFQEISILWLVLQHPLSIYIFIYIYKHYIIPYPHSVCYIYIYYLHDGRLRPQYIWVNCNNTPIPMLLGFCPHSFDISRCPHVVVTPMISFILCADVRGASKVRILLRNQCHCNLAGAKCILVWHKCPSAKQAL